MFVAGQRQLEEWTSIVIQTALHGEATGGTNRERHGSLAERLSVEGEGSNRKAGRESSRHTPPCDLGMGLL